MFLERLQKDLNVFGNLDVVKLAPHVISSVDCDEMLKNQLKMVKMLLNRLQIVSSSLDNSGGADFSLAFYKHLRFKINTNSRVQ